MTAWLLDDAGQTPAMHLLHMRVWLCTAQIPQLMKFKTFTTILAGDSAKR